jgi:hypothetical protein
VDHALVFREAIVLLRRDAFGIYALDRCVQPAEFVATVSERDLREQQNQEDNENY